MDIMSIVSKIYHASEKEGQRILDTLNIEELEKLEVELGEQAEIEEDDDGKYNHLLYMQDYCSDLIRECKEKAEREKEAERCIQELRDLIEFKEYSILEKIHYSKNIKEKSDILNNLNITEIKELYYNVYGKFNLSWSDNLMLWEDDLDHAIEEDYYKEVERKRDEKEFEEYIREIKQREEEDRDNPDKYQYYGIGSICRSTEFDPEY